jgi:hypothetical protein
MGIGNWELGIGNRELGIGNKEDFSPPPLSQSPPLPSLPLSGSLLLVSLDAIAKILYSQL